MSRFPRFRRSKLVYMVIFLIVVFVVLAFVVYGLLNNQLFEASSFSSLHNSSDVRLILEEKLGVGETTLGEVEDLMEEAGVKNCSSLNAMLVCFTAAPKEFVRTDNIFRDLLNYIIIVYSYRIEFEFQDATLVRYDITKSATGF